MSVSLAGMGHLSYEVRINLCEVNLTRVQLTEALGSQRQAPETISFLASNRQSFRAPSALRFPQTQKFSTKATNRFRAMAGDL